MSSNAGYQQMGAKPVAGRVRAMGMHACATGRPMTSVAAVPAAAAHASWLAGFEAKPTTTRIAVPDAIRTRRSRGST